MFNENDLRVLRDMVIRAAVAELMGRFERVSAARKDDGTLITEADLAMQERLQQELSVAWPDFGLLGEEMPATRQQALLEDPGRGLWCLDPLDGTSNFASGIPFFGVSLALIQAGEVQAAVVYDPVRDECFSALRGHGAWLNGAPLRVADTAIHLVDSMAMVDLKRLPGPLIEAVARKSPFRSQRSFGSVALDWCWIASGRCQVYLHGGQKLWDYAAGQLVLNESGGVGGLLDDFLGDFSTRLTLTPRIALAATTQSLLAEWRHWIDEHNQ